MTKEALVQVQEKASGNSKIPLISIPTHERLISEYTTVMIENISNSITAKVKPAIFIEFSKFFNTPQLNSQDILSRFHHIISKGVLWILL